MNRYKVKSIKDRYMIFDSEIKEFLVGFLFQTKAQAITFVDKLNTDFETHR